AESKQFTFNFCCPKDDGFEIRCRKSVGGFDEKRLIKLGLSQSNSHSTFAVPKMMVLKSAAGKAWADSTKSV
uniref:hypothetical protein n=1 Tax=Chryseobacterium mucoviscidosis TaxID=1945581 RepID=UPI0030176EED